jgi:hypothetical protein
MRNQARGVSNENILPAPGLADYRFAPVPPVPDTAITVNIHRGLPNQTGGPVDYAMSEIIGGLRPQNSERTRIFLTDHASSDDSPFRFGSIHQTNGKPHDLQIWYAGTRDIEVGHAAMMSAAIYAPNATVRINGNTTFAGAILANKIICGGNVCICFDEDLVGQAL